MIMMSEDKRESKEPVLFEVTTTVICSAW